MAKRPSWTGFLKLSLVTCPIQLFSATHGSDTVTFHFIHPKTRNRIQMKPFDPDLGEVERRDLVRGYELANGKYVTVTDEDLAQIRLESTKTIDIDKFVDFDSIDSLYLNGAYFLMPDGPMALEAYGVIREAMRKESKAALGRLVLSYREHVVAILPRGKGLILHRLRDAREVQTKLPFDDLKSVKVDPKMVAIASEIIEQKQGKFEPAGFKDPYEKALVALLKRRAKGAKPVHETEEQEAPSNVVNLMDALKKSLGGRRGSSRKNGAAAAEPKVLPFRKKSRPTGKASPKSRKRAGGR